MCGSLITLIPLQASQTHLISLELISLGLSHTVIALIQGDPESTLNCCAIYGTLQVTPAGTLVSFYSLDGILTKSSCGCFLLCKYFHIDLLSVSLSLSVLSLSLCLLSVSLSNQPSLSYLCFLKIGN